MPTLRDHVKETLAAREPDAAAAEADLDAVLARVEKRRRPIWLGVPALAVAAALIFVLRPKPPPPHAGVHLYLHVDGEPADQAVAFDLDLATKGSSR